LGLETCRQLAALGWDVLLGARDASAGKEAAKLLGAVGSVQSVVLDVVDPASVAALRPRLERQPLDALVNNAAVLLHGLDADKARRTLQVNYRGVVQLTDAYLPLLSARANIVMVSSGMGELANFGEPAHSRLTDPALDREDLTALADEFVAAVALGEHRKAGFPNNAYSVSKALLNGYTRVLSRELAVGERRVNAVCPGWVQTDMGGAGAPRKVQEGAKGIVWAAMLGAEGPKGGFFRDGKPLAW
jgi:carbonyl reductase 1